MAVDPKDEDAAVIGRDDDVKFEGDDLEFPSSETDYEKSPTAKHTDFDVASGTQTVDGVKFDLGPLTKGITDGVTSTAKAVAEVSKATRAEAKPEPAPIIPKAEKPAPTTPATTSGGSGVLVIGGGLVALLAVLALAKRRKSRGRGAI